VQAARIVTLVGQVQVVPRLRLSGTVFHTPQASSVHSASVTGVRLASCDPSQLYQSAEQLQSSDGSPSPTFKKNYISPYLKPSGCFTHHHVSHSQILHAARMAFMCFLWMSEQTATLALHDINRSDSYNRGGVCLLCGTH
jgi:hypothetical protein